MNEQENTVKCGYVGPDGVECTEMIGRQYFTRKSHMKKAHGIDLDAAKTETAAEVAATPTAAPVTEQPPDVAFDPRIARLKARAAKVSAEQIQRLQSNAPDVQFGVAGDGSELQKKTKWARAVGIIKPDETPHWVNGAELDQAADDGRDIPLYDREPVRFHELVLTTRKTPIAKKIHDTQQDKIREERKRFMVGAQVAGQQAAAAILPAGAAMVTQPGGAVSSP